MLFSLCCLLALELETIPGAAVRWGDIIAVSQPESHQVWMLSPNLKLQLKLGSQGQGPQDLNYPYHLLTQDRFLLVYNANDWTISVIQRKGLHAIHRIRAPSYDVPAGQTSDERRVAFHGEEGDLYRIYRLALDAKHRPVFTPTIRKGGKRGTTQSTPFYMGSIALPMPNGAVFWADGLDLEVFFDSPTGATSRSVLGAMQSFPGKIPTRPQAFVKKLPSLDRFLDAGCFTFGKRVVITLQRPRLEGYEVHVFDQTGEHLWGNHQPGFPILWDIGKGFLVVDPDLSLRWDPNLVGQM